MALRRESAGLQQACSGIRVAVRDAFSAAQSHAEALEEHRALHTFAALWPSQKLATQQRHVLSWLWQPESVAHHLIHTCAVQNVHGLLTPRAYMLRMGMMCHLGFAALPALVR